MSLRSIAASYESRCTLCDEKIEEGEQIVCVDDEWVHAECAEDAGEAVEWSR